MLLAGVMLKMGAYGMFRIPIALFPHAVETFQFVIMLFGFVSWSTEPSSALGRRT